jgi:hypothetical protein
MRVIKRGGSQKFLSISVVVFRTASASSSLQAKKSICPSRAFVTRLT